MNNELPEPTIRGVDQARQGETGHHVRYVLMLSTALVVIAFIAVYFVMK